MDEELKALAMLALKNAFYEDFSALVNAYLKAAKGLDDTFLLQLNETANVFSRDNKAERDCHPNIWTQNGENTFATTGHSAIIEALEFARATEVHLQGRKVFKRGRNGEWYFIDDEDLA